jgi:predicted deacetylase
LRFDDLCPTMDRARWQRFLPLIKRYSLRPILAVVPDNQDPELQRGPADPGFWAEMRGLEAAGAAIGIHGFQHVCMAEGRSLIPLYRTSEFAGATREAQQEWIRAGWRFCGRRD